MKPKKYYYELSKRSKVDGRQLYGVGVVIASSEQQADQMAVNKYGGKWETVSR